MQIEEARNWLEQFTSTPNPYFNSDFLLTWEHSKSEIELLLSVAATLKEMHRNDQSTRFFESGLGIAIFRDNSTRTRFSFASAVNALGLGLSELDEVKSQVAHGETVRETAAMISFLTETIGIRDDMYLGEGNRYMREVSNSIQEGFDNGLLPRRTSVINLQCDIDHPTQSLADLLHLQSEFGNLQALRGKNIAMTWAYSPSYGKPLSVPQGIIGLFTRFGMDVTLAYPEGYGLLPEVIEIAKQNATESGGSFTIQQDMSTAFEQADIVYPKSWAPFHVMERRTDLLRRADQSGLKELERECLANNARYKNWECNEAMMKRTRNESALYMHCLPADISGVSCEAGEVAASVFDRYRLSTYREAGNKPFIIAAMILLTRLQNPVSALLERMNHPIRRFA